MGTRPNQTNADGITPQAAATGNNGGALSFQPGQRLSACTCKGEDHPGPKVSVGRGAPEIDILEAQIMYRNGGKGGSVSQSMQIAPYGEREFFQRLNPACIRVQLQLKGNDGSDNGYSWNQDKATIYDQSA